VTATFDQAHYRQLIETRGETIRAWVRQLKTSLPLSSAVDAGCGIGFFAQILHEFGLEVTAFDGRIGNVEEARRRFPGIRFDVGDIENPRIRELGRFDLVVCFGLLYHLENPFLAIRNLRALTGSALILESMCFPDNEPWMVLREESSHEDQSLTDVAFYASEGCLVKMLYRAGFAGVYRVAVLPEHDDFRATAGHVRRRTVLLACASSAIPLAGLIPLAEPREGSDPWEISTNGTQLVRRVRKFLGKPVNEKLETITTRWRSLFPKKPDPLYLPFGAKWLLENSALDGQLRSGTFESAETNFVMRFLREGMTVLDAGAHHGFYTLLASKRVGPSGRVVAFEPSPRERRRLERHVSFNNCENVSIEPFALGVSRGQATLFLVEGAEDYCNSLRSPAVKAQTIAVPVELTSLDEFVRDARLVVDFLKLDVEGSELDALRGAAKLLETAPRPVLLVEVYDIRTRPWGYRAREIVHLLDRAGYQWCELLPDGTPQPIDASRESYDADLVAVPREKLPEFLASLQPG
jgi:tRNA (mo5U34)-methyltransferase